MKAYRVNPSVLAPLVILLSMPAKAEDKAVMSRLKERAGAARMKAE